MRFEFLVSTFAELVVPKDHEKEVLSLFKKGYSAKDVISHFMEKYGIELRVIIDNYGYEDELKQGEIIGEDSPTIYVYEDYSCNEIFDNGKEDNELDNPKYFIRTVRGGEVTSICEVLENRTRIVSWNTVKDDVEVENTTDEEMSKWTEIDREHYLKLYWEFKDIAETSIND